MAIVRDLKAQQTSIREEQKADASYLYQSKDTSIDNMFERLLADEQLCKKLNLNPLTALKVHYDIPTRTAKNKITYFVSKSYTEAKVLTDSWQKCNRISEDLILMKILSENECDEFIQFARESSFGTAPKKRLGLVISIVDYFELGGNMGFINEIGTPIDWEKRDVEQFSLPLRDFGAEISVEALLNALDKMRQCRQRGELIAVHCKAGRGRSNMLCVIFLALIELESKFQKGKEISDQDDLEFILRIKNEIKKFRHHIGMDQVKTEKVIQAIRVIKSLLKIQADEKNHSTSAGIKESKEAKLSEEKVINNLLSSPLAKLDISQMTYFKELAIYAAKEKELFFGITMRTKYIQDFFNVIYNATDDSWFNNFDKHMQPLLDANPTFKTEKDKTFRKELVEGFKQELTAYLNIMKKATVKSIAKTRIEAVASAKAVSRALVKADHSINILRI